jgi:hypothetical protein
MEPFPDSLELSINHWITTKNRLSDESLDALYPLDFLPKTKIIPISVGDDPLINKNYISTNFKRDISNEAAKQYKLDNGKCFFCSASDCEGLCEIL